MAHSHDYVFFVGYKHSTHKCIAGPTKNIKTTAENQPAYRSTALSLSPYVITVK